MSQTRLPDELIICDDGSTDATIAIVEHFAQSAPFTTKVFRNSKNLGYSRNFAYAVSLCSQEIIALCDQDDVWYPEKLACIEVRFRTDPTLDGLFSDGDLIDRESRLSERTLWESFQFTVEDQAHLNSGGAVDVLLQRNVVTGMAFTFRARVKGMLLAIPDSWIHDGWLAFLIAARSKLTADPERLVAYRLHGAQQIGAPASLFEKLQRLKTKGVGAYAKRLRESNLEEYRRTALQFTELAQFLRSEGNPREKDLIARIEAKAAYAQRGAVALSSNRLLRWPLLVPKAESYVEFSPNALRTLSRDLLV